jgi:hypothetical protein
MEAGALISRLELLPAALPALLAGVPEADARWKPESGAWSILEIVNHLADEEVLDFRARLENTLAEPQRDWVKIDPEGWAREHRYNERDLRDSVRSFVDERGSSVRWLRSLRGADWERAHQHPRFGPMPAGMLLGAWAAHDALHLRQIAKRLYELSARDASPHPVRYAGEWGA